MAETANQTNDTGNLPPFYVEYGVKEREQFFSDLGNFTPPQLEVFQTLCKMWQPEIPYAKFLSQVSGAIKNVGGEVDRVIARLAEKKSGVVKIHYALGEEVRESIILCAPGDAKFFYCSILNALENFLNNIDPEIPYEEYLGTLGIAPPAAQNLEPGRFSVVFKEPAGIDTNIYRITLPSGKALLLPAGGGIRFINFCLLKLREALAGTTMAAEAARAQEISLGELRKHAEGKDPVIIMGIAKTIMQMKQNPSGHKRLQISDALFHCMQILAHLISCNLEEVKRKKHEEEDRAKDKNALALLFETDGNPLVSEKRFGELVGSFKDKYKNDFDKFRKEFSDEFVTQKDDGKIPVIIHVLDSFIHRNNFFQIFLSHMNLFRETAHQFTVKTMDQILRTNNKSGNTIFFSRENFNTELTEFLRKTDPFLSEIFGRPRILSDMIIYTLKEKRKVRDLDAIGAELEKYFTSDTMQLKGFSVILNISLPDIFQRAFDRLAWWRQLLIKLTGKYASYQAQYAKQGYKPAVTARAGNGSSRGSPEAADALSSDPAAQRRPAKPQSAKKKSYTRKQRESAWNEFSKTLRPK
ncbi:MAG: hypothetical protein LBT68_01370 [Spirochaetales bacterium]|jgi:hypothetical protein|nr:hypothetical protein [Spirochaetales bacterium]